MNSEPDKEKTDDNEELTADEKEKMQLADRFLESLFEIPLSYFVISSSILESLFLYSF